MEAAAAVAVVGVGVAVAAAELTVVLESVGFEFEAQSVLQTVTVAEFGPELESESGLVAEFGQCTLEPGHQGEGSQAHQSGQLPQAPKISNKITKVLT